MGAAAEKPAEEGAHAFNVIVAKIADGDLDAQASEELHELMQHLARESFKRQAAVKGRLTIAIDFKVDAKGVVHIGYDVKSKKPAIATSAGLGFTSPGGNLVFTNPKPSPQLGLREVEGVGRGVREVGAKTPREVGAE